MILHCSAHDLSKFIRKHQSSIIICHQKNVKSQAMYYVKVFSLIHLLKNLPSALHMEILLLHLEDGCMEVHYDSLFFYMLKIS